jgi:hypothetical protein
VELQAAILVAAQFFELFAIRDCNIGTGTTPPDKISRSSPGAINSINEILRNIRQIKAPANSVDRS